MSDNKVGVNRDRIYNDSMHLSKAEVGEAELSVLCNQRASKITADQRVGSSCQRAGDRFRPRRHPFRFSRTWARTKSTLRTRLSVAS